MSSRQDEGDSGLRGGGGQTAGILDRPGFAWFVASYPVLFIAVANPGQASAESVVIACSLTLVAVTVIIGLARILLGSWRRAGLIAATWVLVFYAYGPIHSNLSERLLEALERGREPPLPLGSLHLVLSLAAIAAALIGTRFVTGMAEKRVRAVVRFLNVASIALILLLAARLPFGWAESRGRALEPVNSGTGGLRTERPDVYYVILDGYARADVLARHYGFDNSEFLDGLRRRGFGVNTSSWANYNWTFLSLSSSLNYDYLDSVLGGPTDPASTNVSAAYDVIRRNAAARFLQQRGYRIMHLPSTWGATRSNPFADVQFDCQDGLFGNEFYRVLADASWLRLLQHRAAANLAKCHLTNLATLSDMGRVPGPKFVLAHFILPHYPYLFDADGRVLDDATLSNQFEFQKRLWERKAPYIDQMRFANRRVLAAIDRILAESAAPPIIILQSDHGPNLAAGLSVAEHLHVRLANFAAYRLPGAPPGLMPSNGSPVNQFRRIFNFYFDAGLEILPERHFYSPFGLPFALREVAGLAEGAAHLEAAATDRSDVH